MTVSLVIHGAAGTVTGSCYRLITSQGELLIDCGLFQGPKSLCSLNYRPFPFDSDRIRAVLITHAHIDHSGQLPKLFLAGFRGHAYATAATGDLLRWLLPDSGAIQESEVEKLNRRNAHRGEAPVMPIYTKADAEAALGQLHSKGYDNWFEPMPGVRARFRNAGHILGSAFIELEVDAEPRPIRFVFSGDIGPIDKALQPDPVAPWSADVALIESTYGSTSRKRQTNAERRNQLGETLTEAINAGGNVVIPVFAVERTQEILDDIAILKNAGHIAAATVFLDSPLAGRVTNVFRRYRDSLIPSEDGRAFTGGNFRFSETVEQSKAIARVHGGAIILAGSGMCEAGRVKYHLRDNLWRSDSTLLFVGYQAPGTLGAVIRNGAATVRIHGEELKVKARIRSIEGYSGHADREGLLAWAQPMLDTLDIALLVHGEPEAAKGLATALEEAGLPQSKILIPTLDQKFDCHYRGGRWMFDISVSDRPRLASSDVAARRDWHNDYAQAVLDLRTALKKAPTDASRQRLLTELRRLLSGGANS